MKAAKEMKIGTRVA